MTLGQAESAAMMLIDQYTPDSPPTDDEETLSEAELPGGAGAGAALPDQEKRSGAACLLGKPGHGGPGDGDADVCPAKGFLPAKAGDDGRYRAGGLGRDLWRYAGNAGRARNDDLAILCLPAGDHRRYCRTTRRWSWTGTRPRCCRIRWRRTYWRPTHRRTMPRLRPSIWGFWPIWTRG